MRRPTVEIAARGHRLRIRRRSIAGAAAVGVLGASLAITLPSSSGGSSGPAAEAHGHTLSQAVNVDLAAWSVHTNADSTVTITFRQFRDPDKLRQVLAEAGVPAVVSEGASCLPQDIEGLPQLGNVLSRTMRGGADIVTIKPSAMPPGSVLSINYSGVDNAPHSAGVIAIALLEHRPPTCGNS